MRRTIAKLLKRLYPKRSQKRKPNAAAKRPSPSVQPTEEEIRKRLEGLGYIE